MAVEATEHEAAASTDRATNLDNSLKAEQCVLEKVVYMLQLGNNPSYACNYHEKQSHAAKSNQLSNWQLICDMLGSTTALKILAECAGKDLRLMMIA